MTKQELIVRQEAMRRFTNRCGIASLVVIFGGLLANLPLARLVDHARSVVQALYWLAFSCVLIGWIPLQYWILRRKRRRLGLQCPSCGKPLLGVTGQVAIATGACGLCGEKVTE